MDKFTLRPATEEDLPAIRALIKAVQINPMGIKWERFIVAVNSDNLLLGCGQIKLHSDGSRELASIAVTEPARGQGVAWAIIQELLASISERPIYLMCQARLGSLYRKFGFQDAGGVGLPNYFQLISRAERIFNAKANPENRLLIMRLP